jgi:hypothetical protein
VIFAFDMHAKAFLRECVAEFLLGTGEYRPRPRPRSCSRSLLVWMKVGTFISSIAV